MPTQRLIPYPFLRVPDNLASIWGFPNIRGTILEVPIIRNKYSSLESILGSPPLFGGATIFCMQNWVPKKRGKASWTRYSNKNHDSKRSYVPGLCAVGDFTHEHRAPAIVLPEHVVYQI